jgi:zinc protease
MRTPLPLLGGLLMSATLAATAQQPAVTFDRYSLDNGLTVILQEDHSAPVAAVLVMYHVGSKNEKPGRTGFAHLFEHVMFKGSEHVADGEHFRLLQEIGANINGSTTEDRTNYFEVVPSNEVELALYLESDRMGYLLPAVNQAKLDNQRDVVKNERRQNYDNQPYGTAYEKITGALYPPEHPYSWPVIGSMDDLSAASLDDVKGFFRTYYAPNNAVVVVAGDINPGQTREWIEKYFGGIPRGKAIERPNPPLPVLPADVRLVAEDEVQLPRLFLTWHEAPRGTREDAVADVLASILSSGKSSRLYRALVLDQQIAQNVDASADGSEIAGTMSIEITAKPQRTLAEMEKGVNAVLDEVLSHGVTEKEVQAALNGEEAQLVARLSTVLGRANGLATFQLLEGDASKYGKEFDRFAGITPGEVRALAQKIFGSHKVVLSIVPRGKRELSADPAVPQKKETPQ